MTAHPDGPLVRCPRCGVLERTRVHQRCDPADVARYQRECQRGAITAANAEMPRAFR